MRFCFVFFALLLLALPAQAEQIDRFHADIEVLENGDVRVVETIDYDFGNARRHGIYRDIPVLTRRDGRMERIRIDVVDVTDGAGSAHSFQSRLQSGTRRVRIGSPHRQVSGAHTYEISYVVRDALRTFDGRTELYWNVTGHGWNVPIGQTSATVRLPQGGGDAQLACYQGRRGERTPCRAFAGDAPRFEATSLPPRQGWTLVVGFSPDQIPGTTGSEAVLRFAQENLHWAPATGTSLLVLLLWFVYGRDEGKAGSQMVRYQGPAGITPAVASVLWNERAGNEIVTAGLIESAIAGAISIDFRERNVDVLKGAGTAPTHARGFVEALLDGQSRASLRSGSHARSRAAQDMIRRAYQHATMQGLFRRNPAHVRGAFFGVGILLFIVALVGAVMLGERTYISAELVMAAALPGILIALSARLMPARTSRGTELYGELAGYREYLHRAERQDMERVEESVMNHFERHLPYAIALGVADRWIESFAGLFEEAPTWVHGQRTFDAIRFADQVRVFERGIRHAMTPPPSSSSGGSGFSSGASSGGGFGGGGGGSW